MQPTVIASARVDGEHIALWTLLGVLEDVVLEFADFEVKRDPLAS